MRIQNPSFLGSTIVATLASWASVAASEPPQPWSLEAGFEGDPRFVEIAAGGPNPGGCGFLPDEPHLVFDYVSGEVALSIGTASWGADTTVEVTIPSGHVLCDDDIGGDGDALVTLQNPESDQYEIRVGTYFYDEIGSLSDVFVSELPGESDVSSGTGFLVSGHHIVTNWHVVDGAAGSVTVRALGLPQFQAEIVTYNEEDDIALLYAEEMPEGLIEVAFRSRPPVSIGETVFAFGFPVSNGNFTQGSVSALTGAEGDFAGLQFTAPVQPGSSGSPLFDAEGHVIGMVTSRFADGQLVNFALRGTLVRVFLDTNNVDYELADSDDILPPSDIGNRAQDAVVELIVNSGA